MSRRAAKLKCGLGGLFRRVVVTTLTVQHIMHERLRIVAESMVLAICNVPFEQQEAAGAGRDQ